MFAMVGPLAALFDDVLKRVVPDQTERLKISAELQTTMATQEFQAAMAQVAVNTEEAKKESLFVSGWRPFIGWTCGGAYAYHFVFQAFLKMVFAAFGHPIDLPTISISEMTPVMTGMLGLGVLRTYEKVSNGKK
jgi:Holin of 3TMs, for gene-transfer release